MIRSNYGQGDRGLKDADSSSEQFRSKHRIPCYTIRRPEKKNHKPKQAHANTENPGTHQKMPSLWEDMWRVWQEESFLSSMQKQEHRIVHDIEHKCKIEQYTEEDGQIDLVYITFLNHNHKSPSQSGKTKNQ